MVLSLAPLEKIARRPATQYIILASISIFAVALRFYQLGRWGLWADELYTLVSAQAIFDNFSNDLATAVMSHPLTSILINWSITAYGVTPWSMRLAPAIIGAISVPILYFPVRKIYGVSVAMIFSILLAISPWHMFWSQNARFYPMLMLFSTLAVFSFYFGLEKDRVGYIFLFLVFFGLTASERLIGGFLVPIVLLYMILLFVFRYERPPGLNWRNLSILFVPGIIITLIVAWKFVQDPSLWINEFVGDIERGPLAIFRQFVTGIDYQIIIVGGIGSLILLFSKKDRASLLFMCGATVPLVGTMAASIVQFTQGRYTFMALPFWLLLASYTIMELWKHLEGQNARIIFSAVFFALFIMVPIDEISSFPENKGSRPSWQQAFDFIETYRQPGEQIIANNPDVVTQYFLGEDIPEMRTAEGVTSIEALSNSDERTWFAIWGSNRIDATLGTWVYENCHIVFSDGYQTRVLLCDPEHPTLYSN